MSGVMEKYKESAAEEATQRTKHQAIRNMLELGLTKEQILKKVLRRGFQRGCQRRKNCYGLNTIYNTEINHIIAKGTGCTCPLFSLKSDILLV